jgi:hypothetical protein
MKNMKKFIIILIITCSCINSKSQVFDGIPVSGSLESFLKKMEEKKYSLVRENERGAIMNGYLANQLIEIYIGSTPLTKQVNRLSIFFSEWQDWEKLKTDYEAILSVFIDKYGKPDTKYNEFLSPYDDAGNEMIAIEKDKSLFQCFWWQKEGANLSVQISKYKQVKIVYENIKNTDLCDQEKYKLSKIKF